MNTWHLLHFKHFNPKVIKESDNYKRYCAAHSHCSLLGYDTILFGKYVVYSQSFGTIFYNFFEHACNWVSLITIKVLPSCIDAQLPMPLSLLETALVCLFWDRT
jgi:hypothetical protein